jgi:hypothetical protein
MDERQWLASVAKGGQGLPWLAVEERECSR